MGGISPGGARERWRGAFNRRNFRYDIYVVDVQTGATRNLTRFSCKNASSIAWSPDSRRVAFGGGISPPGHLDRLAERQIHAAYPRFRSIASLDGPLVQTPP